MNIDDILVDQIKAICVTDGRQRVQSILQRQATETWDEVCRWEGKKPTDLFVRVSPDNPHRRRLDDIMRKAVEMDVRINVRS